VRGGKGKPDGYGGKPASGGWGKPDGFGEKPARGGRGKPGGFGEEYGRGSRGQTEGFVRDSFGGDNRKPGRGARKDLDKPWKRSGATEGHARGDARKPFAKGGPFAKGATGKPGRKPQNGAGDKPGKGAGADVGKGNPDWNGNRAGTWGDGQGARAGSGRHAGHRPGGKASGGFGQAPGIKPSKAALGQLLAHYGVALPPRTLDQLWAYHQLLREHNHDQDLTRLIGFDTMAQRHYADCMILHGMMQGRWPSPLVDVGSGAGFPGMMIKLMSPSTRIVLAEPRPRRVQFLEMVIRELGLSDISVFGHKVTSRSLTQPFAGAITRAFETVEKTLPRFGGCLGLGGKAIFMKGPKAVEEVAAFQSDEYRIIRNQAYRIPNTQQDRVLLILERTKVPEPGTARYEADQELDVPPSDPEDG
jgi:16S rRNA (guanine527-N7)-methyltransferase